MSARQPLPGERISNAIRRASAQGNPALVAYLTAGYPSKARFTEHLRAIASAADVVEIGVPFTDPMADGVTVQRSSQGALAQGVSLRWILSELTAMPKVAAPLLLMSYLNPLLAFGLDRLADGGRQGRRERLHRPGPAGGRKRPAQGCDGSAGHCAGADGHAGHYARSGWAQVVAASSGFVYAVTRTGVTGKNVAVPAEVMQYLERVRARLHGAGLRGLWHPQP